MGLFSSKKGKEKLATAASVHIDAETVAGRNLQTFEAELCDLINRYSLEALSNTPDFILAYYLKDCLLAFNNVQQRRKEWFAQREEVRKERESQMVPLE